MRGVGYPAAAAARDLTAAGLLTDVLVPDGEALRPVAPDAAQGGFLGAGLDNRNLESANLFVALPGDHTDGRRFGAAALADGHWVLTHTAGNAVAELTTGAPPAAGSGALLCEDPVAALGCLAQAWRNRHDARIAAVTGTNGKTTTKDLLAALLSAAGPVLATSGNLNNHLGVPLTLLGLGPDHRHAVIEMGASAVGEIARLTAWARPEVGIITNASPAHLAEFGSLEAIIEGKGELVRGLPTDGVAVLNTDSPGFAAWSASSPARVVSFGGGGDHPWQWRTGAAGDELVLDGDVWPVPLPGAHNAANLAAAVLAGRALGVDDATLRDGLAAFRGSPHRGVRIEVGGRTLLDDAYNANPGSVIAAARAVLGWTGAGRVIAVLGTMAELGDDSDHIHESTGRELAGLGVHLLVTVGDGARALGAGFDAAPANAHHCASHGAAVDWLAEHTRPGDRILIKGSRSAAMETVVDGIVARLGANT